MPRRPREVYPLATEFAVGDHLVTVKELSPKIPVGVHGAVVAVLPVTNEIHVLWATPTGERLTKGSPTHGYKKVTE